MLLISLDQISQWHHQVKQITSVNSYTDIFKEITHTYM